MKDKGTRSRSKQRQPSDSNAKVTSVNGEGRSDSISLWHGSERVLTSTVLVPQEKELLEESYVSRQYPVLVRCLLLLSQSLEELGGGVAL